MSDPAIELHRLIVRRGGRTILGVERLVVPRGQVVALLGPNGAGKSTLLKCLLGFVCPTAGEIAVLGHRVAPRADSLTTLRRRIGYVPQAFASHEDSPLCVREVVAIGRTGIAGLLRPLSRDDWRIVDFWLDALGLTDLASRSYASLSGGEQRKTLIAKAMAQQPEMLLLDEPTAHLDLAWREQLVATLERLRADAPLTIVLVCHELEVLPRCTERVLVVREGKVVADGPPQTVLTGGLVESLYGARLRLIAGGGRYAAAPVGGPNP